MILLDPRTAFATCTPEGAHDHAGVIERVIEMDGGSPEVDAANAGNGRLSVEGFGTWKRRDDLERRTCSCAVAVKRMRRFFNATELREGSLPHRRGDRP